MANDRIEHQLRFALSAFQPVTITSPVRCCHLHNGPVWTDSFPFFRSALPSLWSEQENNDPETDFWDWFFLPSRFGPDSHLYCHRF